MNPADSIDGAIAASGSKRNVLVVQATEYNNQRLLGIRRWYVDPHSGEWRPTKKGLSLTATNFSFLKKVFSEHDGEIQSWLVDAPTGGGDHFRTRDHYSTSLLECAHVEVTAGEWSGPEISRVEVYGPSHKLTLNRRHSVGRAIIELLEAEHGDRKPKRSSDATSILVHLLAAFDRIPLMFESTQTWEAGELIDTIRWNVGILLRSFGNSGDIRNEF